MSHRPGGRQVRPDQTKAVKGQNSKTLVMASTIKGPLPCPEKMIEKQSIYSRKKNKVKGREKKIRKKTKKKREKIKEEGEVIQ